MEPRRILKDTFYICEAGIQCLNYPSGTQATLHGLSCPSCDCALACTDACPSGKCIDCCALNPRVCAKCSQSFNGFHCGHHKGFSKSWHKELLICPTCYHKSYSSLQGFDHCLAMCSTCGVIRSRTMRSSRRPCLYCE